MSVDDHTLTEPAPEPVPAAAGRRRRRAPARGLALPWPLRRGSGRPGRPRVRKLRVVAILLAFVALAIVSTLFGMLTAVASDIPQLENKAQYGHAVNSYLFDDTGKPIGILTPPNTHTVLDSWQQISPGMVHAIVAVEDRRFWSDPGVDIRGIARALISDVTGGPREGASTIAEQFVKNALAEQGNRTVFEKLREAALAFQLTHHWRRMKILTQYLNSIYFGNGAYGIESAARVYFGWNHGYDQTAGPNQSPGACGDPTPLDPHRPECARVLYPWESALLAGMVANPSEFDPVVAATRQAARDRRDLVLRDMLAQRYITRAQYERGINEPLPQPSQIQQPAEPPAAPYFTSWVRPQIVSALEHEGVPAKIAQYKAFYGGLKIRLTIDLPMQQAAQQAIDSEFPPGTNGPTAALVAIDNATGEVRAMVSGDGDYAHMPFNLATLGHRQPGSAFKPFTLAEALRTGEYTPDSIIDSAPQNFVVPGTHGREHFIVHNFGNVYSGPITLTQATAESDNSVYSQVGIHVGTRRIAALASTMGIRSPVSSNWAMILGGLRIGVSPLDMAHAYETFATGGLKVYNPTLGDTGQGPIGIHSIHCPVCPDHYIVNHPTMRRVLPQRVATTVHSILEGVVGPGGTAPAAAIPGVVVAGKTGTTSNYVDAWFVGWTPKLTVAVWVGYPDRAAPMLTNYNGGPVEGGTYPAIIWRDFMEQALQILAQEHPGSPPAPPSSTAPAPAPTTAVPTVTAPSTPTAPATTPAAPVSPATTPAATPTTTAPPAGTTPGGTGTATTWGSGVGGTGTTAGGTPNPTGAGGGTGAPGGTAGTG